MTLPSSESVPAQASSNDELFMQTLHFSDTLRDLRNIRKQLYSAAEYFEVSYGKEEQKQVVVENLKDYTSKVLVNTVDHLGSVADKVSSFVDGKIGEISATELRLSCMEQRVRACKEFINQSGLYQQLLAIESPKHHKRYIFTDAEFTEGIGQSNLEYQCRSFRTEDYSHRFKNAVRSTIRETPTLYTREGYSQIQPRQAFSREGTFSFRSISLHKTPEKRATSPYHFSLIRSVSLLKRSTSPSYSRKQYTSDPGASVSTFVHSERERRKDMEEYSGKTKRLFKAMLSMRRSRKDTTFYKFLDEH